MRPTMALKRILAMPPNGARKNIETSVLGIDWEAMETRQLACYHALPGRRSHNRRLFDVSFIR